MSLVNIDTKRNNKVLNSLKVAHEKFTWNGKEIPHIGSYGGHRWHGFGSSFWMHEKHSLSVQSLG